MTPDFAYGLILGIAIGLTVGVCLAAIVAAAQRNQSTPTLAYYGTLRVGESIHLDAYSDTVDPDDGDDEPMVPTSPEMPHNHPIFRN